MRVLGIDPGLGGALALWDADLEALRVLDMPVHVLKVGKSTKRVLDEHALADWIRQADPDQAFCEQVHAMPKEGPVGAFTFGTTYGIARGVLAALGISATYVTPQTWRRDMGVPRGKDGSRQRVTQLLPGYGDLFARIKDDGRAEATLIALFGIDRTR